MRDRGTPIKTPVGIMYVRATGSGVMIDNSSNTSPAPAPPDPRLTVRGRDYYATLHLNRGSHGWSPAFVSVRPVGGDRRVGPTIETKVVDAAVLAAEDYASGFGPELRQARVDSLRARIATARRIQGECLRAVAEQDNLIRDLQQELLDALRPTVRL